MPIASCRSGDHWGPVYNAKADNFVLTGAVGVPGRDGDRGATGPRGSPGDTGAAGIQGPPGATGSVGPVGRQGQSGPAGPMGATGRVGVPGATGPRGAIGSSLTSFKVLASYLLPLWLNCTLCSMAKLLLLLPHGAHIHIFYT